MSYASESSERSTATKRTYHWWSLIGGVVAVVVVVHLFPLFNIPEPGLAENRVPVRD